MHIDQYNQNQNYILYYIHEKYYNDAIVNISLMSLHLLGLSPTLWGDKLVKDSKGKETMWSRISVFCAAHLWQLIDQIAHLITSCVHKLMSCHVSKEKVLAVWDHALGKRQNGCRLSACFGPSAGLCKGSLESGEQQLSPAPCSKVSNHAENCQHRPKPNTHMQNISDYAVVYVASIWSALTAQYVYIYIYHPLMLLPIFLACLEYFGSPRKTHSHVEAHVEALASGVCLFSFWRTDSTSGARRLKWSWRPIIP